MTVEVEGELVVDNIVVGKNLVEEIVDSTSLFFF